MKILLTGGSGFIGRNLVEELRERYEIVAPASAELDLTDAVAVERFVRASHFDAVVHTATTRSNRRTGSPAEMLDRNLHMYFNLARCHPHYGRLIHFGSGAEYGRPGLPAQVKEDDFGLRVPADPYGFSKYICTTHALAAPRTTVLRLFGVFGRHEAWDVRFISNACARAVKGLPIVIRQDVRFDYLYAPELARLLPWFLEHEPKHAAYNVCLGRSYLLSELAAMVATASGTPTEIIIRKPGLAEEYGGDNHRMLAEIGGHRFRPMEECVRELYLWYKEQADKIDERQLRFDEE